MLFYALAFQCYENNGQKKDNTSLLKKNTKKSYHNDIWRWKRDIFFRKVETKRGIIKIKILKRELLKKSNELN